jgi:hypothetical protein
MRTMLVSTLIACVVIPFAEAQETKQQRIDAAINSAERVCLVGNRFKFQMDAQGNLTILKIQPGVNAQIKIDQAQASGGVLFEKEEVRRLVDDSIRLCMQSEWPKVLRALEGPSSSNPQSTLASLAESVAVASRGAQEAADRAKEQAKKYPSEEVAFALRRAAEIQRSILERFRGEPTRLPALNNVLYWGELRDGNPNGIGRECCWRGGTSEYLGEYTNGRQNGYGRLLMTTGVQFAGKFAQNRIAGPGCIFMQFYTYCGNFDGEPKITGVGMRQVITDGGIVSERFVGTFGGRNFDAEGYAIIHFLFDQGSAAAGTRYEGEIKRGARNGYGIAYFPDGTRYEGQWSEREMQGFGRRIGADGKTIVGGFWENSKIRHVVESTASSQ